VNRRSVWALVIFVDKQGRNRKRRKIKGKNAQFLLKLKQGRSAEERTGGDKGQTRN